MSLEALEAIRLFELDAIIAAIRSEAPEKGRVLEIGAGTGWQAKAIAKEGYRVEAIDLPTSVYAQDRVYPIKDYDGHVIPFPDGEFDMVYSSNVLEHVAHADAFQKEILRVLKPGGVAVHVVPSGSWRFWSNIAHYPYMLRAIRRRVLTKRVEPDEPVGNGLRRGHEKDVSNILKRLFIPSRDGEVGNAFTEIYYLSRWRWTSLFERNGWKIEDRKSNHIFYTAYYLLGTSLSPKARSYASRMMGGSCHVYLLRAPGRVH